MWQTSGSGRPFLKNRGKLVLWQTSGKAAHVALLLKRFHDEAVHRAKNHLGLLPSNKRKDLYTIEEIEDNDERFFNFVTDYIHHRLVHRPWQSVRPTVP